ncbi:hypothetical protein ILUMI_11449 [Ignelater luminosus]|uniref:Uncharacterized protein n=1 Tax=Ignelater luminosus TaxID=2038154 RepID=A0A8K0CW22_IGNLU|nr:hypothetical protein ILUMI_11449 [Ignelater luminosus]
MLTASDRCKITDPDAIHIIISIAEALGTDAAKLVVNTSSLQRARKRFRDIFVNSAVESVKADIVEFCSNLLKQQHCREDYKEFLELIIMFSGDTLARAASNRGKRTPKYMRFLSAGVRKRLTEYPDSEICSAATKTFSAHLWYLAPEAVALAFFDLQIPIAIKVKSI